MNKDCLLLVDGNSMLFRAYYATSYSNMMKTSSGIYTNAIYAFAVMLKKAIDTLNPKYVAVCFDKGKHTFRHDLASDYKGGRKPVPEELVMQFSLVRSYLDACAIPYFEYDEIEADDIIGSLSTRYPEVDVAILSSDKDLLQLIDDNVFVYLMKKGISEMVKMDRQALLQEYELEPKQIIDLKGLMGDTSDNIKGVKNIGPKTAIKLLKTYTTVENIYAHIDEISERIKKNLLADEDSCYLSKKLATIITDLKLDIPLENLLLKTDNDARNAFYKQYEMFSLISKDNSRSVAVEYRFTDKVSPSFYQKCPFIYLASNEFSYYERVINGLALSDGEKTEYISIENLKKDQDLLEFLAGQSPKIVYDLKAAKHAFEFHGLDLNVTATDDLMLMAFLNNNYLDSIEAIFDHYGKHRPGQFVDIYGTPKKPLTVNEKDQAEYACAIALRCKEVYAEIMSELESKELMSLYQDIEKPLLTVLYDMEVQGIVCDDAVLDVIAQETFGKMSESANNIYALVGHEFNLNSPKQLAEVLFDELALPDRKKRSTSIEVLQKLVNYHPIISELMDYRKFAKLYSTYAEGLKKYIQKDGKIHTIFSQTITQTGRLSSYDPNLQNISVKDEDGKMIRKAFKASENHILMSSDYSQIELRVLASLADEKRMIEAFNEGIDIHTKTAMDILHVPMEAVDDHIRRQAKAINFGVVYGISDFGLSKQASLSIKEAKHFIEEYFNTYPNIKTYMDKQIAFCKENGYVKTMMNRRRYIKEINDNNFMVKEFGKRAAMNSPIQGSAADLIKMAMINITKAMKASKLKSKLILQVHDELIFDVDSSEIEIMKKMIKDGMSNAYKLKVRLDSSLAMGESWYEAK